jgi:formylmethanofuran dehydrogenase subunit E
MRTTIASVIGFLLINFISFGQEKPVNPFTGKELIILTDGSTEANLALLVQLSIRGQKINRIIVSQGTTKQNLTSVKKLIQESEYKNLPIVSGFEPRIGENKNGFICVCMGTPEIFENSDIPKKLISHLVLFTKDILHDFKKDTFPEDLSVDILKPKEGNLFTAKELEIISHLSTENGKRYSTLLQSETHREIGYEMLPVYLLFPELINMKPDLSNPSQVSSTGYDPEMIKSVMVEILSGDYQVGDGVAFAGFPMDPVFYKYDVRRIMDTANARFGAVEWKACVLTDEIHGHLGIYSIVGAKMGILARDYFKLGPDKLKVVSFAGSRPPKSCLNDGLQASTGATLGQGLITVSETEEQLPEAIFEYQGKRIRISLKESYRRQIDADIGRGIAEYGLLNAGYWKLIRQLSLNYWRDWNRSEMFDITVL